MEKENGEDEMNGSINTGESEQDMSFVTKVRSRVSGLFNSSISRLFGSQERQPSTVRRRESDDFSESQPPRKRAKQSENNFNYIPNEKSMNDINNRSQMFTNFVEPTAGTSGIRSQKISNARFTSPLFTDLSNEDKYSESGESTSGYSSMPRLRQHSQTSNENPDATPIVENKSGGTRKLFNTPTAPETTERSLFSDQSLFADRSLSPQAKNTSLSSRRPSFNVSSFGSPNFVDRTITTSRIVNSPFYNGPTTFGGASAYDRTSGLNEMRRKRARNAFIVKPVIKTAETNSNSLSKTARRILDTLEQYSTPLSDVKKIPLPAKGGKKQEGLLTKYIGANPYKLRQTKESSNKELLVPTTPDLLKMKQRLKLQETTDKIRQIATASTSKSELYKVGDENQQKYTNKMKTKISSVRDKAPAIQVIEHVVIHPVPLEIPENKLPKFDDFHIPPPVTAKISTEASKTRIESKQIEQILPKTSDCTTKIEDFASKFVFSSPLVIADNLKSIVAINNFKFSEPVCKKVVEKNNKKKSENKINNGDISVAQNLTESLKSKPSDPLMERFKPPAGSWECSTCLVSNKAEALKCIACETLRIKERPKKQITPNFGTQFNKKPDEWECTCCLVRNKISSDKCVACSASKPSTKTNGFGDQFKKSADEWECQTCLIRNKNDAAKCAACETSRYPPNTFGDKFKAPSGTWECQTCLVRNKNEVEKCVACETKRAPNKAETWECDTCLIRNKMELKSCAACRTPKDKNISIKSDVAIVKSTEKWECPTCMVRNNNDVEKCPCCETSKPGTSKKNEVNLFNFGVNKSQFSFGIPKEANQSQTAPILSFAVKNDVKENNLEVIETKSPTPAFTFGIPNAADNKDKIVPQFKPPTTVSAATTTFKFGSPSTTTTTATTSQSTSSTTGESGFKFDLTKPLVLPTTTTDTLQAPKISTSTEIKFPLSATKGELFDVGKNPPAPIFPFGKPENLTGAVAKPPSFNFVSSSSTTSSSDSKGVDFASSNVTQKKDAEFSFNPQKPVSNLFPVAGGAPKNGGFNFGNNPVVNSNRTAVFSFGATQNLPQAAATADPPVPTKAFKFSAPATPSGGFNFSAPTFDSNAKPSFNFTGGNIPTFAATPTEGGGAAPVRKFKKAVRRAAQR